MSKATYWKKGGSIDYKNEGTAKIEANTVVNIGTRIGIAGNDIDVGDVGTLVVEGVFILPFGQDAAVTQGNDVYYKGGEVLSATATGAIKIGWAIAGAGTTDETIKVKIG